MSSVKVANYAMFVLPLLFIHIGKGSNFPPHRGIGVEELERYSLRYMGVCCVVLSVSFWQHYSPLLFGMKASALHMVLLLSNFFAVIYVDASVLFALNPLEVLGSPLSPAIM